MNNANLSDPQEIVDTLVLFFESVIVSANSNTFTQGLCNTQTNISLPQYSESFVFQAMKYKKNKFTSRPDGFPTFQDKTLIENYRAICILPNFSKVFEIVI